MRKIILFVLFCVSCSTQKSVPIINTGQPVLERTYYQVVGAGELLKNTDSATLAIWIRPEGPATGNEDIFNVSVGGKAEEWKTRAGFRVTKDGAFQSVARADDFEELSEIITVPRIGKVKEWQHVALTVDYKARKMEFFVDGEPVEILQSLYRFTKPHTSDTNSHRVTLGAEDDGRTAYFNGDLAGAHVERRVLSQKEIQRVMRETRP